MRVYKAWNIKISTGMLNDWIEKIQKISSSDYKSTQKESLYGKILYASQNKTRPPTINLMVNHVELFKLHIKKFLRSKFIDEFHLQGVPVRLEFKDSDQKLFVEKLKKL